MNDDNDKISIHDLLGSDKALSLHDLIDKTSRCVDLLWQQTQHISPIFHICVGTKHMVGPAPPSMSREEAFEAVRKFLLEIGATAVIYIDEAWLKEFSHKEDIPDTVKVKDIEGRKEVVLFSGESKTEGSLLAMREITRDGDQATLGPLEYLPFIQQEGRLTGMLFPPQGSMH